jgi:hypothetical protein
MDFLAPRRLAMTLAAQLQDFLDARAARDAARQAQRLERDAFIQAQFPLLNARLIELIGEAVGLHSRLAVSTAPMVETVVGRSFESLNKTAVSVAATVEGTAQSVALTPRLDFREPDQFGALDCAIDFSYRPRRSRKDAVAAALLAGGVQMKGTTSAHLMLAARGAPVELSPALLEAAFAALLLR